MTVVVSTGDACGPAGPAASFKQAVLAAVQPPVVPPVVRVVPAKPSPTGSPSRGAQPEAAEVGNAYPDADWGGDGQSDGHAAAERLGEAGSRSGAPTPVPSTPVPSTPVPSTPVPSKSAAASPSSRPTASP